MRAVDTFEMLIQQQWDAGEKRLKEILVAISAFGDFGKDVHHSYMTLRVSTAQEIAAGLEEMQKLYSLGYASDSLAECLWKESTNLVALLSRCADEWARRGHDVTAKREFIATVQPKIESLGEHLGWKA